MSVRRLIVEVDTEALNVTEFCAQHGVSTWFFYQLRRRFREEGEAGLQARSRAAKRVANRTPAHLEDLIIAERKDLSERGMDAGPATIAFHLAARLPPGETVPSEATIWRVLTRRGFVTPNPKKAPKRSWRRFVASRVNESWQIDDTEWELADGHKVKIINILDDCSRVVVASKAALSCNTATAWAAFSEGASRWGWPTRFISDNAPAFREGLAAALRALGVDSTHSRPHHPQTCGKVERFHQTLQRFLTAQTPAATLGQLQQQLDTFAHYYNHTRPHRALGRKTPAQTFAATPKAGPAGRPLGTPTSTHQVTVHNGTCYINRRYAITVGAAHNRATATVIITGTNCHIFIAGQLTRQLTLDPTRRTQPLHPRPGNPRRRQP